jgi:hypothetical protein
MAWQRDVGVEEDLLAVSSRDMVGEVLSAKYLHRFVHDADEPLVDEPLDLGSPLVHDPVDAEV